MTGGDDAGVTAETLTGADAPKAAADAETAESTPRHMVLTVAGWALLGVGLYYLVRLAVLAVFAVPFLVLAATPLTAGVWLLVAEPVAVGVGAYLTLLTKVGNRLFRTVLSLVVFASALIGHVTLGLGNPFVPRARGSALIAAWVAQTACIVIGATVAARRVARRAEATEAAREA